MNRKPLFRISVILLLAFLVMPVFAQDPTPAETTLSNTLSSVMAWVTVVILILGGGFLFALRVLVQAGNETALQIEAMVEKIYNSVPLTEVQKITNAGIEAFEKRASATPEKWDDVLAVIARQGGKIIFPDDPPTKQRVTDSTPPRAEPPNTGQ